MTPIESDAAAWVAILIPTFNRRESLLRCLAAVRAMPGAHKTYVVFDGCTDGSEDAVGAQFPEVVRLRGDGNLWWSGAINVGAEAAIRDGASHLLFYNDDVEAAPTLVAELLRCALAHPRSVIGPAVYHSDDRSRVWSAGGRTDWLGRGTYTRENEQAAEAIASGDLVVEWLPGMGTLTPSDAFLAVKGVDAERFPQYFGDADFCLRAGRAGYQVRICPEARLFNEIRSTGIQLPPGPIRWKHVHAILTHRRSHMNWVTRTRFWGVHCPPHLVLWQVLRFYIPILTMALGKLTVAHLRGIRR